MASPLENARDLMEKLELPFCLMASTLLGIHRGGSPIGKILEFAVLAKDVTKEKLEKLDATTKNGRRNSDSGLAIIDLPEWSGDHNNFEIHLVHFKNGYSYHNISGDAVLVWPEDTWQKKNWGKITWAGKEWNTPAYIDSYLAMYYGLDWRTPQPFTWGDAPNHLTLKDIDAKKIWFDELTVYCNK